MFTKSARFYDALYHFKDYAAASSQLHALVQQHVPNARSLLDVGCGTGKHLEHLQHHYRVVGLDLNPDLLAIAVARCPGVLFHQGDMVDFRLGERFDVVTCLFSAIAYVKSLENMERAVAAMVRHLRPGGLLIVEPWVSPDQYWVGRVTANFVNEPELKIAWMYISEIEGSVSIFDINYMVGTPDGIQHFSERHEMGLFTHEQYAAAFQRAGLAVQFDPEGFFGRGMYLGVYNGS
jgi:SAM-dependent methyltransferase